MIKARLTVAAAALAGRALTQSKRLMAEANEIMAQRKATGRGGGRGHGVHVWVPSVLQLLAGGRCGRNPSKTGILRQQPRRLLVHTGQCGAGRAVPQPGPL